MRGHMDAPEFNHVVLGLLFLKYISDAFQEKPLPSPPRRARTLRSETTIFRERPKRGVHPREIAEAGLWRGNVMRRVRKFCDSLSQNWFPPGPSLRIDEIEDRTA